MNLEIGTKIGLLTIVSKAEPYITPSTKKKSTRWLCKCECGKEKIISQFHIKRTKNPTRSCGCLQKKAVKKHGYKDTSEYSAWNNMKDRCYNKNHQHYDKYGGRGINVCNEWKNSFEEFIKDIGNKPSKEYTLERIDNNKGYYPENCKWETKSKQAYNRRKPKNNSSGTVGVYYHKDSNKWQASINHNKTKYNLGYFTEKEEAIKARKEAELKYYGRYKD